MRKSLFFFLLSIGLLGLLCFMLPASVWADTVYTYRGNPYSTCDGIYANTQSNFDPVPCTQTFSLFVSFDTTLSGSQLDNLTLGSTGEILADVTSLTMTDGLAYVDLGGVAFGSAEVLDFDIATDANGNIIAWSIGMIGGCFPPYNFDISFCRDAAETANPGDGATINTTVYGYGYNQDDPGSWAVPEPTTLLQLGISLLGLILLGTRKQLREVRRTVRTRC